MDNEILDQLVALSNHLGQPELDYAILGEGNTSARADAETFFVKASGHELRTLGPSGLVRISFARALALSDQENLSDQGIKEGLVAAKIDPAVGGHPSVETLLHALCLQMPEVNFVGHTHPAAVNMLTCSTAFETCFSGRLFPDEVVVCGPAPLLVPYIDPGLPLARAVRDRMANYVTQYGAPPRVVLMQNHGMIALGRTPEQVQNITAMMCKTARVLLGALAAGGPRYLPAHQVERIHSRPDEAHRRQQLGV